LTTALRVPQSSTADEFVDEFGASLAFDLVGFIAFVPAKADYIAGEFNMEIGLHRPERDFVALVIDRERRGAAQVEVSAIPEAGIIDAAFNKYPSEDILGGN